MLQIHDRLVELLCMARFPFDYIACMKTAVQSLCNCLTDLLLGAGQSLLIQHCPHSLLTKTMCLWVVLGKLQHVTS
jgi:hypothetical protein